MFKRKYLGNISLRLYIKSYEKTREKNMITINLLKCVESVLKSNGRCYADIKEVFLSGKYDIGPEKFYKFAAVTDYNPTTEILDTGLYIKGDDFIIDVRLGRGYVSLLNFIDLRVPKKKKDIPNFFSHRYGEYVGD
jgi:hypothetical protein|nr:MAG TPA: hypothetical protein [Caudoviricetes sp.]